MRDEHSDDAPQPGKSLPPARYLSSSDIEGLLQLLVELKEVTLSRASYRRAANFIAELGGGERFDETLFVE
jgi:hypothetical protein